MDMLLTETPQQAYLDAFLYGASTRVKTEPIRIKEKNSNTTDINFLNNKLHYLIMVNTKIYNTKLSKKTRLNNYKNLIIYPPISKGLILLIIIFITICLSNQLLSNILTYSLALATPLITVTLIYLKESFSGLTYEKKLKSSLIEEIIFNLQSIKSNEYIITNEVENLKKESISTDPLVKMVWDIWDIIKFQYSSKEPDFDLNIIYEYIRDLYVINEAIDERRLYTTIHISSRIEFNKVIDSRASQIIPLIKGSLESLNTKMFIFNNNISIDEVATTLNNAGIPMPIEIVPLLEDDLDELIVIFDQN